MVLAGGEMMTSTFNFQFSIFNLLVLPCALLLSCTENSMQDPDTLDKVWTNHSPTGIYEDGQGESSSSGTSSDAASAAGSSSSAASSSSSAATVSSSSVAASSASYNNASLNTQTCIYTPGTGTVAPVYGTLKCTERTTAYKTVQIGSAVWMAENLDFGTRVDAFASTDDQSNDAVAEKYCYGDVAANCATDGGLYQWAEAMQLPSTCNSTACASQISSGNHQGICPKGWHVPKASEWTVLTTALEATANTVGKMMKLNNTSNSSWDAITYNDNNSSGFSALPAGLRLVGGGFHSRGIDAYFWDASEDDASFAYNHTLSNNSAYLSATSKLKTFGLSLRCVKD
jgi:uncharacterized protein (TIGR02145 family)